MSNYPYTILSIPSILNFDYVTEVKKQKRVGNLKNNLLKYLIENNRTVRFLKDAGYEFVFIPSLWTMTAKNRHADVQFNAWPEMSLRRQWASTELRVAVLNMTPLRALGLSYPRFEHATRSFEAVKLVSLRSEPTFLFAHFMIPHRPFVVDAQCRKLPEADLFRYTNKTPEGMQAYLGQVECANRRILDMVRAILSRSDPTPIILIQGDHGTRSLESTRGNPGDTITALEVRERLGAFGAYLLPAGGGSVLGDSITAVNLMRYVLSYYLSADLKPLPDSLFYSAREEKFSEFSPVSVNGGRVPPIAH